MGKRARAAGGGDRPAKNYVYTLNLAGGHKYVGTTTQPVQRIGSHFAGAGAKWTQKHQPISVNSIMKCKSAESAKKAETIVYQKMSAYHGADKVRGAGHTKST